VPKGKKMNAQTTKLIAVLVLVATLTMTSGCALEGEDFKGTFLTMELGKARAATGNVRRRNAKGATTTLTNPFAETTNGNGEVENIMD
jgi:hypothetical protein